MTVTSPLLLTVLDRELYKVGDLGAPVEIKATPRHNAVGEARVTLGLEHHLAGALWTPGALAIVRYAGLTEPLISGPVVPVEASDEDDLVVFQVIDAKTLLWSTLGWPKPDGDLAAQDVAYDTRTGPAETVAKGVVLDNARRLGIPVVAAPDLGRGATVTGTWRMHPIADRLIDLLEAADLGISVQLRDPEPQPDGRLRSPGLVVDCYQPRGYPRQLSDLAGTVTGWKYTGSRLGSSRRVLGASESDPEDPTTRVFLGDVDADVEALCGPFNIVEQFRDLRSLGSATGSQERRVLARQTDLRLAQLDLRGRTEIVLRASETYRVDPTEENGRALEDAQQEYDKAVVKQTEAEVAFGEAIAELETARVQYAQEIETEREKGRADGAARAGLTVTLQETGPFRYGDALRVGDRLRIEVGGLDFVEVLRNVNLAWTYDEGLVVTPTVGETTNPYSMLQRAVSGLLRRERDRETR